MKRSLRARMFGVCGAAALTLSAGTALVASGVAAADAPEKLDIQICHRGNSVTNPYQLETPANEGVLDGHYDHIGPIFNAADPPPPPHNGDQWGDIIPPSAGHPDGMNWTDAGQAILNNDCVIPFGDVTVQKAVVDPDGVSVAGTEYKITLTCTLDGTVILDESVSLAAGATSAAFEDVQGGAHCDAVEDTTGIADLASTTTNGPVVVAGDMVNTVTVTNTFAGGPAAANAIVAKPALTG